MAEEKYFETRGINTYVTPLELDGQLIYGVNVISWPYGAKTKRSGYSTFLGTVGTVTINSLLDYHQNDGTTFYLYGVSGSLIKYSTQGTGAWTIAGNGTISNEAHFGAAQLDNTFIGGDGVGSTRHTTNGTSFTNTTLAPIASEFEEYQNRIYAMGTASDLFYSTTNDATNWATSGTADSSSFKVPGAGKLLKIFKCADRLLACKNSGEMFKWDGYSLIDMATKYGPSSPYSIGGAEGYKFLINRYGHYGFGGSTPQLLSNAIQRQFYNDTNNAIVGSVFKTIPATCHKYDYLASVGSVTDNFTNRTINNCIIKYDFQKNEYLNWDLAHKPTAFLSFTDVSGTQQLIFGGTAGQCYKFDNSFSDSGQPIQSEIILFFNYNTLYDKKWNFWRGVFNPGCQARAAIACSNTFTYTGLRWEDLGDLTDGVVEYKFPPDSRSKFLFLRIYDSSTTSRWTYYGCSIDADIIIQR